MRYQCQVLINDEISRVTTIFLDPTHRPKWQTNLKAIKPLEKDHGFILTFKDRDHTFEMKETIKDNHLPNSVTTIYEVPGVYNECKHNFSTTPKGTLWTMDVLFEFEDQPFQKEEDFICKTQSGMQLYKRYIENLEY
ncbi:MAG: SRPBCC family protein [Candidatus Izemoplasmataceae bacterium]